MNNSRADIVKIGREIEEFKNELKLYSDFATNKFLFTFIFTSQFRKNQMVCPFSVR